MTTHELLIKARAIQADRGHAKHIVQDRQGHVCVQGAVMMAASGLTDLLTQDCIVCYEEQDAVAQAMCFDTIEEACYWNNSPLTTLGDVLARFDKAIEETKPTPKLNHLPMNPKANEVSAVKVEATR